MPGLPGSRLRWRMTHKRTLSGAFDLPALLVTDIRLVESGVNVTVHGEIDVHTAPLLRARLDEVVRQREERVVVHLDDVTFMDSTALGVLVGASKAQRATGGTLELVCSDPRLLRILHITGLHEVLTIHDGSSA
jgi:anti-sigma B factor antagonist